MIRTLIVDDSAIVRAMVRQVMKDDGRFDLIGEAENGEKAVLRNEELKPDLIIMDYNMPVMNGLESSRKIFETSDHLPAIVTFTTETDPTIKEDFLAAGILAFFQKPNIASMSTEQLKVFCDNLVETFNKRSLNVIPSGKYFANLTKNAAEAASTDSEKAEENDESMDVSDVKNKDFKILVIGASTGGPEALKEVLSEIGPDFPLPILITQHIDSIFDKQLAQWLSAVTKMPVQLAKDNITAKKGRVYLAPADKHLKIESYDSSAETCTLALSDEEPIHFLRPAVDVMFKSAREKFKDKCIAVLLTGMGADGSSELLKLKETGAYTICQDEESCVVFGMPKAAIDLGAEQKILPVSKIGKFVWKLVK